MLQVLIVDDEPTHIWGLIRHIPWDKLGFADPLTAKSGEDALSILQAHFIDVLITDISMPGMNGIELAAFAKSLYQNIQILIISGYNEFEFAQEAIEIGVQGYMLKPLKLAEIKHRLTSFRQTLENIRQINEQTFQFQSMMSDSLHLLKESFISELLEDEPLEVDTLFSWCRLLHLPEQNVEIQLVIASLDGYATIGQDPNRRLMLSSALMQSVKVSLQDKSHVLVSKLKPDEVVAIMVNPEVDEKSSLEKQMRFVQNFMKNTHQASVTICISREGNNWNEVQQLFRESRYTITDARQSGTGLIVYVGTEERKTYEDFQQRENLLPSLLALADRDDSEQLMEAVRQVFKELNIQAQSFAYIQSISIGLLGDLSRKLWHDTEAIIYQSKRAWHRLLECTTVEELEEVVLEYIETTFSLARKERTLQQHHLINRIVAYLEDQVSVNVTVKQLADMFYLSAGHLRVLFKKEMGLTISDFVKNLRMKKAKELLQDPTIKIYEVAERVGFQTPAYFTYQFKKNEGYTPQEYRDRYYR